MCLLPWDAATQLPIVELFLPACRRRASPPFLPPSHHLQVVPSALATLALRLMMLSFSRTIPHAQPLEILSRSPTCLATPTTKLDCSSPLRYLQTRPIQLVSGTALTSPFSVARLPSVPTLA